MPEIDCSFKTHDESYNIVISQFRFNRVGGGD